MTALIGYTNRKTGASVGFLMADDLEGVSKARSDKLIKINKRFVVGVTGLEVVAYAITYGLSYFEPFDLPNESEINSLDELQTKLGDIFRYFFPLWKEKKIIDTEANFNKSRSDLIILDCDESKLYFAGINNVWVDNNTFQIEFNECEDGCLYTFGLPAGTRDWLTDECHSFNKEEIINIATSLLNNYQDIYRNRIGNPGAYSFNSINSDIVNEFVSAFKNNKDYIDEATKRIEFERSQKHNLLNLQEAVAIVLLQSIERTSTIQNIADEINRRKLYFNPDSPVSLENINFIVDNYGNLFEVISSDMIKIK